MYRTRGLWSPPALEMSSAPECFLSLYVNLSISGDAQTWLSHAEHRQHPGFESRSSHDFTDQVKGEDMRTRVEALFLWKAQAKPIETRNSTVQKEFWTYYHSDKGQATHLLLASITMMDMGQIQKRNWKSAWVASEQNTFTLCVTIGVPGRTILTFVLPKCQT